MTPIGSRPRSTGPSELDWSRLRGGVAALVLVAVGVAVVFVSDVVLRELSEGPRITVTAAEARELEPGSAVWVAGVPAGRVTSVRFREAGAHGGRPVVIRAVLREEAAGTLRSDAAARIRASSLLAPSVVALDPGHAPRPWSFGDTLAAEPALDREDVLARADSLAGDLRALRPLADSLRLRLRRGPGTLAALRRDDDLRSELRRIGRRTARLADALPRGTAARLAADTAARARMARAAGRLREIARRVGPGGGPGRLLEELRAVAGRLERLGRRLDAGRGTLGRLHRDEALQRERRELRARMDSVRAQLLADPLRWLRAVRVVPF